MNERRFWQNTDYVLIVQGHSTMLMIARVNWDVRNAREDTTLQYVTMPVEITKVNKSELLYLDGPRCEEIIKTNEHMQGVTMDDHDTKDKLPVHIILGASEFAKLKTEKLPRVGLPGQPVAELTRYGWTIMSPAKEPVDVSSMLLAQTSQADYEELCRIDVLGLEDRSINCDSDVYEEFKEQLT